MLETVTADEIITKTRLSQAESEYRRQILTGLLEIIIGLAFGLAEGVVVDFITGGISEIIPGTEFLADVTAVGLLRFMGIHIPDKYLKIGYVCSLVPVIKDLVNPATLDGAVRIWTAHKQHIQAGESTGLL